MHQKSRISIHICLRIFLGGIFLWASWDKIVSPEAFARIIGNYQLLPESLVPLVAIMLPWTEAICGICLVAGIGAGGAALIVNMLVVVFIAALSMNLFRGIDVNCGCFSVEETTAGGTPLEIARDVVILVIGLVVLAGEIRAHNGQRIGAR
ncbi:MAG: MauE/DoxX family redox-associated membrane protein [Pseudomonadota bacterium]